MVLMRTHDAMREAAASQGQWRNRLVAWAGTEKMGNREKG